MVNYQCPKCGMKYSLPGKCTMDGAKLIKQEDQKYPSSSSGVQKTNHRMHRNYKLHQDGEHSRNHHSHHEMMVRDFKKRFFISLALTFPVLLLTPLVQKVLGLNITFKGDIYVLFALSAVVFFYAGLPFLKGSIDELKNKLPGMMTLIATAISSAFIYSSIVVFGLKGEIFFWELVTLIDIMLLGHWIEMRSVMGASKALEALAKLVPSEAHLVKGKRIMNVPISNLVPGDIVLVKPGEKVPSDGIIFRGESSLNESMLTGESKPVSKKKGDKVIGASINGEGALYIKITNTGEKTYLSQVIQLVKQAQESKSKTQDLANRAATWLTLISISIGTLTLALWLMLGKDLAFGLERMVTIMIITCPHALGLAVPLVVAVSTAISAKNGFLIRDRVAFENIRDIDTIVFDKTGTLTKGEFGVTDIVTDGLTKKEVLFYAASLEINSEHPIAKGIVKKATEERIRIGKTKKFKALPGKGIQGVIGKKDIMVVGPSYLAEKGIKPNKISIELEHQGKTVIYILIKNKLFGAIALADIIREESKEAISTLKSMGIKCMMLTGDNQKVAEWVSKELGLDDFFAGVLPDQKAKTIKKIQSRGLKVVMVGDGVNDAPALVQADAGIAIGAGTDVAIESADIVLVRNDPRDVASIIGLAKATYSKMKQNLLWATGYNIVAIPLAAGVMYHQGLLLSPALGAVFMSLSTIVVAINARLLKLKK
ncbi:cadmium-translocating P-type ATPase [Candidatus Woesearchaeota archaeon]|nr:cadmium-translocating P-type ATPase [Candidatus Woesearchaeota archaeon]